MLKFEESERPSFIELAKLVLTSTENTIDSPKAHGGGIGSNNGKNIPPAVGGTGSAQHI